MHCGFYVERMKNICNLLKVYRGKSFVKGHSAKSAHILPFFYCGYETK